MLQHNWSRKLKPEKREVKILKYKDLPKWVQRLFRCH